MASLKLVYLFTIVSFIYFVTTKAQGTDGFKSASCSDSLTTPNSAFQLNLRSLLSYLSSNATANKQFYNTTAAGRNQSDSTVYGMFMCWGDVPPQPCSQCVVNAIKSIDSYGTCSLSTHAAFQYDDCMVRFSNRSFFSIPDLSPGNLCSYLDVSNQTNLMSLLSETMKEAADEAANSAIGAKKYATKEARIYGSFQTLYCQAQCTPDLSPQDCRKCLNTTETQQRCKGLPAIMDTDSCRMRCDVYPFYRPSTTPAATGIVPVSNSSNTYSQDPDYLFHNCKETKITELRAFQSNLRSLLSSLTSKSTIKTGFFSTTVDMVSGLFMCRGDLSPALCQLCVINATQRISSACPSSKEAIIWYNNCLLRYSNNRSSLSTLDTTPIYQEFNIHNTTKPNQLQSFFTWTLANTLKVVQYETDDSTIKNYGTKAAKLNNHQTLYTLAQCTPDLSNGACGTCLDKIFNDEIPWCCLASPEGKVLYPSCYIMFGLSQFYTDGDQVDNYKPARSPPSATTAAAAMMALGVFVLLTVLSCGFRSQNQTHRIIEGFLKEHGPLPATRYSYSEVKKMTNSFRNKLGQGGFGSVYKGKLHDGRVVAVKILNKSEGNGEEFINEVASISKTLHVNIVRLLGFCSDNKQALIYEFMSNGSLDKFIYEEKNPPGVARQLDCKLLYDIAIGIARGLEYLHRGCNTRILHFDIKPHNILLDEDFSPKISDFGLAKLCLRKESIVSILGARGTAGYIAPEVFSRNFGAVSHKSDVYSYGMMVLEMVGMRHNSKAEVSRSSEIYFPHWIYTHLESDQELGLQNIRNESDDKMVRKMTIVGLWCIQTYPPTRPAISRVVEMLESKVELLQIPPKPRLSSSSTFPTHFSSETNDNVINENTSV